MKRKYFTNAYCVRDNSRLFLSPVDGYCLTCLDCQEDFYGFEVKDIKGEWFEICISMTADEYEKQKDKIKKKFFKVEEFCFLGYDYAKSACCIGFFEVPNEKICKEIIKYFNLKDYEKERGIYI